MSSFPALFEPLKLGSITIRNRIGMSALTRNRSANALPNHLNLEYYVQRAASAGLVVTEGTLITPQGTEWPDAPGIWNKEQITAWKGITNAIHEVGGQVYAQLWHLGRVSHPDAPQQKAAGVPVYAPSAIAARGGKFRNIPGLPGYVVPTAVPDPRTLIALYKQAAINAKEAGFDGVELHGANGYLVTQFLDSGANQRTDEWGGSIENRARFGIEVLKELIEVFGAGRVAIKLSPAGGYNDVGMPLQETLDTYTYFINEVEKLKIAYIVFMRYTPLFDIEIDGKKRATQHDILGSYGHLVKNAKLFLNGGVTPEEGNQLVASGKVNGIFIGTMWIPHPDLAKRVQHGKPLDNPLNVPQMQGHGGSEEELRVGYTDYPEATY